MFIKEGVLISIKFCDFTRFTSCFLMLLIIIKENFSLDEITSKLLSIRNIKKERSSIYYVLEDITDLNKSKCFKMVSPLHL